MPHVVYDSSCAACNAFRRWIAMRDQAGKLVFVGNRTDEAKALLPSLTDEQRAATLHWLSGSGDHHQGARAVFSTVASTGGLLGVASAVLTRPPLYALFEPAYRLFAKHRSRLARFFRE